MPSSSLRLARAGFATCALALALVVVHQSCGSTGATPPGKPAHAAPAHGERYAGSASCAECHAREYAEWRDSLHSKMEQAATPKTVIGAFTPEGTLVRTEAAGKRIVLTRRGDEFFVEAPTADGGQREFAVERTVGNRYKQRYLTRFEDGSWHTLPVQWFEQDQKFVEWHHQASAAPGTGKFWMDDAWQWQLKCAGCHTTGLELGYDTATKTYASTWSELAIGCEACHGFGVAHVAARGGTDNILCPSELTFAQQLDTCGQCHSRGTAGETQGAPAGLPGKLAYPAAFTPGDALDAHFVQATPANSPPTDFWNDGSSRNHHQQLTDYRSSEMFHHGSEAPSCTTCHEPHRAAELKATIEDNALCNRCHAEFDAPDELAAHTGHGGDPVRNAGARCVECHMPRIVDHAGSTKLRAHTYWAPDPARAAATETPDACRTCHTGKDAAWSARSFEQLWPRRRAERR